MRYLSRMLTSAAWNPFENTTRKASGRKRNSLGGKIGSGYTRSFRERNKWHLRGSIYRLIWISRTSNAFLPSLFSSFSSLWLSVSVYPVFAIFIVPGASIHPLVLYEGCFHLRSWIAALVPPTSLHSTLNVCWWKSLLCRRFYPLLSFPSRVDSFKRFDSSLLWFLSASVWLASSTYPISVPPIENI